jgi:hypothetical protein
MQLHVLQQGLGQLAMGHEDAACGGVPGDLHAMGVCHDAQFGDSKGLGEPSNDVVLFLGGVGCKEEVIHIRIHEDTFP